MSPTLSVLAPLTPASLPGERLVALSALCVLAIATVFFVERLGVLSAAREPTAPLALTAPEARSPYVADASPIAIDASLPSQEVEGPAAADEARTPARARPRATVATVRRPDGKAEARSRLAGSVPSSAALAMANEPPVGGYVRTRWDLLRQEIGWCARQASYFDAVMCEQRARLRWCEEWWGRASECPSGRQVDYAN